MFTRVVVPLVTGYWVSVMVYWASFRPYAFLYIGCFSLWDFCFGFSVSIDFSIYFLPSFISSSVLPTAFHSVSSLPLFSFITLYITSLPPYISLFRCSPCTSVSLPFASPLYSLLIFSDSFLLFFCSFLHPFYFISSSPHPSISLFLFPL